MGKKASAQLLETLANYHGVISIDDAATGGRLQATLVTPETSSKILFNRSVPAAHKIIITGMQAYWASQGIAATELHMQINQRHVQRTLRCYDADALWLAVEVICDELDKTIIEEEGALKLLQMVIGSQILCCQLPMANKFLYQITPIKILLFIFMPHNTWLHD